MRLRVEATEAPVQTIIDGVVLDESYLRGNKHRMAIS